MLSLSQHIAEKEQVQILPKFRLRRLKLVTGTVGPFVPGSPAEVPLWLALLLRKQSRCTIVIPDWLSKETLERVKKSEKEASTEEFQRLHERYREIASLLLHHASSDFEDAEATQTLIADIEDLRQHKIRRGMQKQIDQNPTLVNLTDLSALEVNEIRPFLLQGLGTFDKLTATIQRSRERQEQQQGFGGAYGGGTSSSSVTQVMKRGGRKLTKYG